MKIRRAIPPSAAPISCTELLHGFLGIMKKGTEAKLEKEIKKYFGAAHVFLASSGKAALFLILSGLKCLTGKKKVIIPAYTCFSVPSAIRLAGLEIVLCDIEPGTLDFDFSRLKSLIDDDTLCVISTHLFGIPADTTKVSDLCEKRKIFVVEDAAQAMGAVHGWRKLGDIRRRRVFQPREREKHHLRIRRDHRYLLGRDRSFDSNAVSGTRKRPDGRIFENHPGDHFPHDFHSPELVLVAEGNCLFSSWGKPDFTGRFPCGNLPASRRDFYMTGVPNWRH